MCPLTVSCIYAILQQIYVQFCLDLQINVLLVKFLPLAWVIVGLSSLVNVELLIYGYGHPCFNRYMFYIHPEKFNNTGMQMWWVVIKCHFSKSYVVVRNVRRVMLISDLSFRDLRKIHLNITASKHRLYLTEKKVNQIEKTEIWSLRHPFNIAYDRVQNGILLLSISHEIYSSLSYYPILTNLDRGNWNSKNQFKFMWLYILFVNNHIENSKKKSCKK